MEHKSTHRRNGNDRPQVLIVDDEDIIRIVGRPVLEQAGLEVQEAQTGEMALTMCQDRQPDLILLDVKMPGLDGFETCGRLRSLARGEHTPIVMMTSLDDLETIELAYERGATDFVVKPFNWMILSRRIEYMLQASQAAHELRESEARLANAQRIANLGYWEWDRETKKLSASGETLRIFGRQAHELNSWERLIQGVHPRDRPVVLAFVKSVLEGGEVEEVQYRVLRPNGSEGFVRQQAEARLDGGRSVVRVMGTVHDVTEQRKAEQKIRFLANFDSLTGLPNRRSFTSYLDGILDASPAASEMKALLWLDLDRFKRVNETLGERVGDDLLQLAAARLLRTLPPAEPGVPGHEGEPPHNAARFGGDEFLVFLPQLADVESAAAVARRLCRDLGQPFQVGDEEVFLTASIGISIYPHDGVDAESLIKNSASAMSHARSRGGNRYQYYNESMNLGAREKLDLEGKLRQALAQAELTLLYQPQIHLASGKITGAEALLRWQHPEIGPLLPLEFVPLAEEIGLITVIGDWVLESACNQAQEWQAQGLAPIRVAVNLSAKQFVDVTLTERVQRALEVSQLDPGLLELELTEGLLMEKGGDTIKTLYALKALGIHLSVDDFGVGFSSLSYLRHFPVDTMKIDRTFLKGIPFVDANVSITRAIIALAKNLKLRVVAEGVETEAHLRFLKEEGCDEVQGFLVGRPMPPEDLAELMALSGSDPRQARCAL